MARGGASVRDDVLQIIRDVISYAKLNPLVDGAGLYQEVLNNYFHYLQYQRVPPSSIVNRQDFDVMLIEQIIEATRHPTRYTREHLDSLQHLGDYIHQEDRPIRDLWPQAAQRHQVTLDYGAEHLNLPAFLQQLGRDHGWRDRWVRGTMVDRPAASSTTNNNSSRQESRGTTNNFTAINRQDQARLTLAPDARQNLLGMSFSRWTAENYPTVTTTSNTPNATVANIVSRATNTNNIPRFAGKPARPSQSSGAALPANDTTNVVAPNHRASAITAARNTASAAARNTLVRVTVDAFGTLMYERHIHGAWEVFARHVLQQHQWRCALCNSASGSRRRDGSGILLLGWEDEFDEDGCLLWGKYVHGDPKPEKCTLCENHPGFKAGTNSLKRHIAQNHGIDVTVPPITAAAKKKHEAKKLKAKKEAAEKKAAMEKTSSKTAAKATSKLTLKRTAEEAGLDDDEQSEVQSEDADEDNNNEAENDDEEESQEDDEPKVDSDGVLRNWLGFATGEYQEGEEPQESKED